VDALQNSEWIARTCADAEAIFSKAHGEIMANAEPVSPESML
jgi:hypothetical protein